MRAEELLCSHTNIIPVVRYHSVLLVLDRVLSVQDWTKQENEDAEGVVSFSYRTKPESPPDVQTIQKQMAIVAWQPGPNRIVQVPSQVNKANICSLQHHCSVVVHSHWSRSKAP